MLTFKARDKFQILKIKGWNFVYLKSQDWSFFNKYQSNGILYFLDDRLFNQKKISLFEQSVRKLKNTYYYSEKFRSHYDQFEVFEQNRRFILSSKLEIQFQKIPTKAQFFLTPPFHYRGQEKSCLLGDVLSLLDSKNINYSLFEKKFITKRFELKIQPTTARNNWMPFL
jgi:hypothetical protein